MNVESSLRLLFLLSCRRGDLARYREPQSRPHRKSGSRPVESFEDLRKLVLGDGYPRVGDRDLRPATYSVFPAAGVE